MKKLYNKIAATGFVLLSVIGTAFGQTCIENSTVSGQDDSNPSVLISTFPCTGGGTITAVLMDASIGADCAAGWYSYDVVVNGATILTNQCDQTGVDLTPYLPLTSVQLLGHNDDTWSDFVTLDLTLNITYIPASCPSPNTLTAANITSTSADVSWTEAGTATLWDVEYGVAGFTPTGTPSASGVANPYSATGLTAATTYDFYVRADCGGGSVSVWTGPFSFSTLCTSYNVPWSEGFESITTAGQFPLCVASTVDFTTEVTATTYNRGARTGTDYLYTNWTADDWFFTAGINLTAGTSYDFSAWYNTDGNTGWDTVSLWVGTDQAALMMTDSLTAVVNPVNMVYNELRGSYTPLVSGVYYFAIHVQANGNPWYISFDDLLVELTPACPSPSALATANSTTTTADLSWTENGVATLWDVEYGVTGFTPTGTPTVSGVTNPYTATGLTAATAYDYYVRADCGGSTSTWVGPFSFSTLCTSYNVPWSEGFESITTAGQFPLCVASTVDFTTEVTATTYNRGARTGTDYLYTNWTADDWFFTAGINLTAGTSYDFSAWYNTDGNTGWNEVSLWAGTDQTALMMTDSLTSVVNPINMTYTEVRKAFVPTVSGVYYFGIHVIANGNPWYLSFDDILVELSPACPAPSSLSASNIMDVSADLNWTENGSATLWDIELGTAGFTPTGTPTNTGVSNPYTATGLIASTSYDYYVRADCGGSTSSWVGPYTFTTACPAVVAPWIEDFENAGTIPACWSQGVANMEPWIFNTTGGHVGNAGTIGGATTSGNYFAYVDDSTPDNTGTTLESPFIDVSALTAPMVSFFLISNNEGSSNVDFSIDVWDGASWNVGFYTHNTNTFNGEWERINVNLSTLTITGAIKLRFIVDEAPTGNFNDDVAIDDVEIKEATLNDLKVIDVTSSASTGCSLSNAETVTIAVVNLGMTDQSNFDLGYTLNGSAITPETITSTLLAGDTMTHTFAALADMSVPMLYNIDGYTLLAGDQDTSNDTLSFSVKHIAPGLAFNDSLFVSATVAGGTHGIICTNGLLPNQLSNCYSLSAVVIDSLLHTWDEDLEIYLIAPSGDTLELSTLNGGSGDNYIGVVFTDTAANNINTVTAGGFSNGGYYAIEDVNGLASLNGIDPNGMWDLWVVDGVGGDDGMLFSWHLEFTDNSFAVNLGADTSLCTDSDSLMLDAGAGSYVYNWSTMDSTQTIVVMDSVIGSVNVSVTVTDTISQCTSADTITVTFGDCSGISEYVNLEFSVYPNPNNGTFSIVNNNASGDIMIQVIDVNGKLVYSKSSTTDKGMSNSIELDVPAGIYSVRLISNQGVGVQNIVIE